MQALANQVYSELRKVCPLSATKVRCQRQTDVHYRILTAVMIQKSKDPARNPDAPSGQPGWLSWSGKARPLAMDIEPNAEV